MPQRKLISICIPVLNEQENVRRAYEAVAQLFEALSDRYDLEIVFTDNRSTDCTFEIIREIAQSDARVRAVQFAHNIGYQKSIMTGYLLCHGAAAIQLDCDLQDPPEIMLAMLECWERGNAVVYGVRQKRMEGFSITLARRLFYRLISRIAADPIPVDSGDFRLIDRRVIEVLRRSTDQAPYLRGLIAAMGLKQVGIPYDRNARVAGSTKFGISQLLRLSFDAVTSQSTLPLRLATFFGFGVSGLVLLAAFIYLVLRLTIGANWPDGFATLLFLSLGNLAITSLFFGLLGEYIGRISRDVKQHPFAVVDTSVGFEGGDGRRSSGIVFTEDFNAVCS